MNQLTRRIRTTLFAGALVVPAAAAFAQDQGQPDPEEIKKKVLEIEHLMKSAEQSLAASTDTRTAAERSAEAARKILDEKAKKETGKSGAELRKEAEGGSKEAKEALDRLTKAANEEAQKAAAKIAEVLNGGGSSSGGAGTGVKNLIEKIKGDGQGASEGIKWLLKNVRVSESPPPKGGGGSEPPQKPDKPKDDKPEQKPETADKKPPEKKEPPHSPEFEQWIAELPPQVRKAYDTQDWDSIPPKWREMIRAWADKLSKEDGKERR